MKIDELNKRISGRKFHLWDYSPSHSRLLIRSPMRGNLIDNIDIVFYGVIYVELTHKLGEMSLIYNNINDGKYKRFRIKSENGEYVIDAVSFTFNTNTNDLFDSPLKKI